MPSRVLPIPAARLAALRRRLLAWWAAGHRDLPWRFPQRGADPYRVWLAEVMLQQTRVEAVIPYYRRFVERWPTLEALARAADADVFAAWSGLGYYARCRNLLAAARAALLRHGGLPPSLPALRALPGFGPYTAGAVASIAFALPAAAVDGNVARVLARVFAIGGDPSGRRQREQLWAVARALVGEPPPGARAARAGPAAPGDWNQALMELGATVCGRSPACAGCPVAALCAARAAGLTRAIPPPRRRVRRVRLTLACAVVERAGRVLLARRPPGVLFAGLLAFPCVELPDGADPGRALRRALGGLGLHVRPGPELATVERTLTHRDLRIRAFRCVLLRFAPAGSPSAEPCWVPAGELDAAGMPAAMRALLSALPGFPDWRTQGRRGLREIGREACGEARLLRPGGVEERPCSHPAGEGGRRVRKSRTALTREGRNV